ncbi:MAG: CaiB/BaiF CoA transferase family protein [Alphaproteobacteria bacterium]
MLDRIRILDLTWVLGGPYATMLLAQLGADIIKVETGSGDMSRKVPPHYIDGESTFFLSVNRGKRSVVLDLKHEQGAATFRDLVRHADAVIYNMTPSAPRRLGIDHATLVAVNPRICVGEMIGLHDEGAYATFPALDLAIQALGGIMSITGEPGGKPVRVGNQIADLAGGLYLALGAVAALLRAFRTGQGQHVQISLLDCQIALLTWQAQNYLVSGKVPERLGSRHPMIAPSEAFHGSDGGHFVVSPAEIFWKPFCHNIGRIDLIDDPRFATAGARIGHVEALADELQRTFDTKPAKEWIATMMRDRIPAAMVNSVADALAEPVVGLRHMVETVVDPASGAAIEFLGNAFKYGGARPLAYPPRLGEHTREVLRDVCGYEPARIDALARAGAIGVRDR